MKCLLDTHVWVWCHAEPKRLGKRATAVLRKAELWLSPISLWELLLLTERGRIRLAGGIDAIQWIDLALERAPARDAPLSREVAKASRRIGVAHDDPADRFLAATAAVHDLTLVTADARLLAGKGFRTLDAQK